MVDSANAGEKPVRTERTPGYKLLLALLVGFVLSIPLLAVYALNYDRQSQSETARASITQGWGGPQTIAGPAGRSADGANAASGPSDVPNAAFAPFTAGSGISGWWTRRRGRRRPRRRCGCRSC